MKAIDIWQANNWDQSKYIREEKEILFMSEDENQTSAPVATNCTGELKELPAEPGRAYNRYECLSCHQVVVVSHEDLELSGLPPEHSPTPAAVE